MVTKTRRDFLKLSAGLAGATAATTLFPESIRKALAIEPSSVTGTIQDVQHIVVFMQENRSFDPYFGTLRGVRGFSDPTAITLPSGKPVWYQPDADNPDGYELPFHLDTLNTAAAADGNAAGPFTMGY
jgi:phospholipase C